MLRMGMFCFCSGMGAGQHGFVLIPPVLQLCELPDRRGGVHAAGHRERRAEGQPEGHGSAAQTLLQDGPTPAGACLFQPPLHLPRGVVLKVQ